MNTTCGYHPSEGAGRPRLEVADIFQKFGPGYREKHALSALQARVMQDIETCRTAVLGGHLYECDCCDFSRPAYNSCRNRHCPKCGALDQALWVNRRLEQMLPLPHFHVVITLPSELRPVALVNRTLLFNMLLRSGADTLLKLCRDPQWLGGQPGITGVLHSWSRDMSFHPHGHFIVSGGGLSLDQQRWVVVNKEDFLFPAAVVKKLFRGIFMGRLVQAYKEGALCLEGPCECLSEPGAFERLKRELYEKKWVVHIKEPIRGPDHAYHYLARYVRRVAISNERLIAMNDEGVTFRTRDDKQVTLKPDEFIRRFLLHIVPPGFVKIREYGLYASGNAGTRLTMARTLVAAELSEEARASWERKQEKARKITEADTWEERLELLTDGVIFLCPRCGFGRLRVGMLPQRPLQRSQGPDPPPT